MTTSRLLAIIVALVAATSPTRAAAIRAATVGCSAPGNAARLAALQGQGGAQATAAQPLLAERACLSVAKNLVVTVDETKPPLSCIRLSGDLSCYWVSSSLVDEHPGEKGGLASKRGNRRATR